MTKSWHKRSITTSDSWINVNIFRKLFTTDAIIPANPRESIEVQISIFRSLIHRVKNIQHLTRFNKANFFQ